MRSQHFPYFCGHFIKYLLVTAFKRNENPKDYPVHAKLWTILYITESVPTKDVFPLNIRRDLPPPIPFVIQYSDKAGKISKLLKD